MTFEWDTTKAEAFIEKKRRESKLPIGVTHFAGFCASRAMTKQPDFDGRMSFGNVRNQSLIAQFYSKDRLDIAFTLPKDGGRVRISDKVA